MILFVQSMEFLYGGKINGQKKSFPLLREGKISVWSIR